MMPPHEKVAVVMSKPAEIRDQFLALRVESSPV